MLTTHPRTRSTIDPCTHQSVGQEAQKITSISQRENQHREVRHLTYGQACFTIRIPPARLVFGSRGQCPKHTGRSQGWGQKLSFLAGSIGQKTKRSKTSRLDPAPGNCVLGLHFGNSRDWFNEQLTNIHIKSAGKFVQHGQCGIGQSGLDTTHIRSKHSCPLSQLFLSHCLSIAQFLNSQSQRFLRRECCS